LESECALIGGETAEMPGVYEGNDFDCAGFAVGVVDRKAALGAHRVKPGMKLLGISSSGFHSNGFSLLRKLFAADLDRWRGELLKPTALYVRLVQAAHKAGGVQAIAHITGGGIPGNLNRILPKDLNAMIDLDAIQTLPVFGFIKEKSGNDDADMIKTYNLGVGMTIVVDPKSADSFMRDIKKNGVECYPIGSIQSEGSGTVEMKGEIQW
jgi:phosphoribosylformylglycinamidine cyclo-ligase